MGVAIRYVKDESTAKDIVQESFVRIFNSIPKFQYQNENAFKAWIKRITAHEAIRWLKKYNVHFLEVEENTSNMYAVRNPSVLSELYTQDLLKALQSLPQGYQVVFNLYIIEGFSHKENSSYCNCKSKNRQYNCSKHSNYFLQWKQEQFFSWKCNFWKKQHLQYATKGFQREPSK